MNSILLNRNIESFYVNQYDSGLESEDGDCGSSLAAMILKAFGFLKDKSSAQSIEIVRQACEVTEPRNNNQWAINEDELKGAITKVSNGTIHLVETKSWGKTGSSQLPDYLKQQLDIGRKIILLTGSPYSKGDGRHYMLVTEVKDDGTVIAADPALAIKKILEIDNKMLAVMMRKTNRGTEVLSFEIAKSLS